MNIVRFYDMHAVVESRLEARVFKESDSCKVYVYDHGTQVFKVTVESTSESPNNESEAIDTTQAWIQDNYAVVNGLGMDMPR